MSVLVFDYSPEKSLLQYQDQANRIMKFVLSFLFEFIHSSATFCKHQKSIFHISIRKIKEIKECKCQNQSNYID